MTPDREQFNTQQVSSGRYDPAGEVVHEALRLLRDTVMRDEQRAALRADIAEGIAALDSGNELPADDAFARLIERRSPRRT